MNVWQLYAETFAHWLSGGSLILRDKMSSLGIKTAYDRFLTKKYVVKVWTVKALPIDFNLNLSELVRDGMFIDFPNVKTLVQYVNTPTNPRVEREIFKRQLKSSEDKYLKLKEIYDSLSAGEKMMGKVFNLGGGQRFSIRSSDVKRIKAKYDSYRYVYHHKTKANSGEFFKSYVFIHAYAKTNEEMQKFSRKFQTMMDGYDVFMTEVKGNVSSYLANFGPAAYRREELKSFSTNLFSDENLSYLTSYRSRGLIGGTGTLMGLDQLSRLPLILNFHETSAAQVLVFLAKAGWGKTLAAQFTIMGLLAKQVHAVIVDLKGGEWIKLKYFVDSIIEISANRFVNTMRLDDLDVDDEDAVFMYDMAVSATVRLMSIMTRLDPDNEGNPADLELILRTAVEKVYSQLRGFNKRNPRTFHYTKDLKYEQVLAVLEDLKEVKSLTKEQVEKIIPLIILRCGMFFSSRGDYNKAFKEEINLSEILNYRTVIFSLNKNTDPVMTVMDDVNVFMCGHISSKKAYVRKKQGLQTVEVFEEVQRTDEEKSDAVKRGMSVQLIKHISDRVTGARSDNVMIILLTNSIASLKREEAKAIRSNLTTIAAGKLSEEDSDMLVSDFGCPPVMRTYLKEIASGDPNLNNCFALYFDNGSTVENALYKAILPDYMEEELRQRDRVVETISKSE